MNDKFGEVCSREKVSRQASLLRDPRDGPLALPVPPVLLQQEHRDLREHRRRWAQNSCDDESETVCVHRNSSHRTAKRRERGRGRSSVSAPTSGCPLMFGFGPRLGCDEESAVVRWRHKLCLKTAHPSAFTFDKLRRRARTTASGAPAGLGSRMDPWCEVKCRRIPAP